MAMHAAEVNTSINLLCNPEFSFHANDAKRAGDAKGETARTVAFWNTGDWDDMVVMKPSRVSQFKPSGNVILIRPGKRVSQFASLPDLGVVSGDRLSLAVEGFQEAGGALTARLCAMRVESADGKWTPKDFNCSDKRSFARHGRGELLRDPVLEKRTGDAKGIFTLTAEGLEIDSPVKENTESSSAQRNVVGILVEFQNTGTDDVLISSPRLSKGPVTASTFSPSRPPPSYFQKIPRTMKKLWNGEPLHIIALGSSIDRASANPPIYLYDEDMNSPTFKQPLSESVFEASRVGRLDLAGYIGSWQHYFMYTGRLRLELMRRYNYPMSKVLLNCMACDGSCMGEAHSGLLEYATLSQAPGPDKNGHPTGKTWKDLYPEIFTRQNGPRPDLVIFGHGANEHIDTPDEIAQFEGAIRWYQSHYPGIEFIICMNRPSSVKIKDMQVLAEHYGIPFIPFADLVNKLRETTCNFYALYPDGGHAQAAVHYLWAKKLEEAFAAYDSPEADMPQKHLPKRLNAFTYGWEGEITTTNVPSNRIAENRFIVEDTVFNVWARHDGKESMKIRIDGKETKQAGSGVNWPERDSRNSSFVYGRLSLGDRHIVEIIGQDPVIKAVDMKIAPRRAFIGADSPRWQKTGTTVPFASEWGSPYGAEMLRLAVGASMSIEVEGSVLSVAYVDTPDSGSLIVIIDGEERLLLPSVPFMDSNGKERFCENRAAIRDLPFGKHSVVLKAKDAPVSVLGLFTYDTRDDDGK